MRIVLDLQGAQTTGSRHRGIGRYTLSLAQAIARQAGEHEVIIALNGLFPDTVEPIRAAFDGLLPQENILVWQAPGPVRELEPANTWRRQAAERLREAFLASLKPDVVWVSSLFEGLVDDSVTSIGTFTNLPTAVTIYDLIPLLHREHYLQNPGVEAWYLRKLDHMRRAHLWLAISESSRREGINCLGLPEELVVNISSAADARFRPVQLPADRAEYLCQRYGLVRPFVMYTGGIDYRKNIERLIRAYAGLPEGIRKAHQLAIVCSVQPTDKAVLERLALSQGLAAGEVVFTGFVPDEDLLALYNLCKLFVFPSWHEGFGLPALEAMACGAAVIGANTSSLPEVIGRADALFDPFDEASITAKMQHVLIDEDLRADLQRHGLEQAGKFSWESTARRVLDAFERLQRARQPDRGRVFCCKPTRPRLAYVSPLPPEKSGIADYSAELLPELSRHYEIDVIVEQPEVADPWIKANCSVRSSAWFADNAWRYDRLLYHFGNSPFHQHMFGLLEQHPGVVVLHDFYLSGVLAYLETHGIIPRSWSQALYLSHGYYAVLERFQSGDTADVVWQYPCNLAVLQQALGVIVHSHFSRKLAVNWYGQELANNWQVIPLLRAPAHRLNRVAARQALGLAEGDFVVCSFGMLGPTKLNHRLLAAWLATPMAKDKTCRLVFVGENHGGEYGASLLEAIHRSGCGERIKITGFAPAVQYRQYLAAADVAVQLRALSRGETSAAVLDCMNYGLPAVVNAHGSLAELPADCVVMLPDEFADEQLARALEMLWREPDKRRVLSERARAYIAKLHAPRRIADMYAQAIETFYEDPMIAARRRLVQAAASLSGAPADEKSWADLAWGIAESLPLLQPQRQLLLDISVLVHQDAKSGIQRVVRSVLKELLKHPPAGFKVEPVYATAESSYYYARSFTMKLLNCPQDILVDELVELHVGDIFLGLDLTSGIIEQQKDFLAKARRLGAGVFFVVYDLLPVRLPSCFPAGVDELHKRWLSVVAQGDGALCISRAVADELAAWLDGVRPERHRPFHIGWFHLGADIEASLPTTGLPDGFIAQLEQLAARPTVLMVGTVEPRKGHAQALAAFERLWEQGVDVNLVIVGKQGWLVETLAERLQRHPELGRRLFWYQGISDEALLKLYETATGVLMASEGEGFGLPLIEAAQHQRPILARDIPVFREVAGGYASYFSGSTPEALAEALKDWLAALQAGTAPASEGMPWQTWAESTKQIVGLLTDPNHPNWLYRWMPNK